MHFEIEQVIKHLIDNQIGMIFTGHFIQLRYLKSSLLKKFRKQKKQQ